MVATGWGGLTVDISDDLLVVDQVPHDWLFGRVAAVVHHGGGGTTAAALAAGTPQVVCPFVADQPHWACRMQAIGVAPEPLPHKGLTADTLASAITKAVEMRNRAREVGAEIRAEDGVRAAVAALEDHLA